MPFTLRPYRRFPCLLPGDLPRGSVPRPRHDLESLLYRVATLGDLPMRPGERFSLTVTLPNEQRIVVPEAAVRWSRGQEFAAENLSIEPHTQTRLQHS